ncbi:MAG TPA: hypothetical protein VMF87_26555 [Streptosporangiaceae bacterium]|nr:hypothetical protein [Streptosporangiaceae bacterium]
MTVSSRVSPTPARIAADAECALCTPPARIALAAYPTLPAAYSIEYPAAWALGGRAARRDRLRVNCTPDCSNPATTSAPAIQAREGTVAASVTQAVTPSSRTRLCARSEPGHLPRAPYRAAPRTDANANAARSGPAQPTAMPRCFKRAGSASSASATREAPAAPVA